MIVKIPFIKGLLTHTKSMSGAQTVKKSNKQLQMSDSFTHLKKQTKRKDFRRLAVTTSGSYQIYEQAVTF